MNRLEVDERRVFRKGESILCVRSGQQSPCESPDVLGGRYFFTRGEVRFGQIFFS